MSKKASIVYDEECPVCARLFDKVKDSDLGIYEADLVEARGNYDQVERTYKDHGRKVDDEFALEVEGKWMFGAEALLALSEMSTNDKQKKLLKFVAGRYRLFAFMRLLLLIILGKSKIESEPSVEHDRPVRRIMNGMVIVAIAMIIIQIFLTNVAYVSRWQGAGFGMYTDPHPFHRAVHLTSEDGSIERKVTSQDFIEHLLSYDNYNALIRFLVFPTDRRAQTFFEAFRADVCGQDFGVESDAAFCAKSGKFSVVVRDVRINMGDMTIDRDVLYTGSVASDV